MKKLLLLLFLSSVCFAQIPTPAKAWTPLMKLKQYRSGAINIADSLNWNMQQIDKYVDTLFNKKYTKKGFVTLRGGYNVIDTATVSLGYTQNSRIRSIWFDGDSVLVIKKKSAQDNSPVNDTLVTRKYLRERDFAHGDTITYFRNLVQEHSWLLSDHSTLITQNADSIVSQATRINTLGAYTQTLSSSITQLADSIELKVSYTEYNGSEIVSRISLSPDSIKISSDHIEITGPAVFRAINGDTTSTVIKGGALQNHSITTDKLVVDTLSALTAILGNVSAGNITGSSFTTYITNHKAYTEVKSLLVGGAVTSSRLHSYAEGLTDYYSLYSGVGLSANRADGTAYTSVERIQISTSHNAKTMIEPGSITIESDIVGVNPILTIGNQTVTASDISSWKSNSGSSDLLARVNSLDSTVADHKTSITNINTSLTGKATSLQANAYNISLKAGSTVLSTITIPYATMTDYANTLYNLTGSAYYNADDFGASLSLSGSSLKLRTVSNLDLSEVTLGTSNIDGLDSSLSNLQNRTSTLEGYFSGAETGELRIPIGDGNCLVVTFVDGVFKGVATDACN